MVRSVPIHVGRVPVHLSEYIASHSWCHHDIQESKSPLFFLLNCFNVGGHLVEVCVEGLQVLLSMKPDDEGVICIALQRKDKSANFSTSRTRDQQPTYNRLITRSWSSTSARPLSTQEEDILSLGLSFAIIPRQIPYQEIISATEATAHRLGHGTADALKLAVCRALQQAKTHLTFQQQ